MLLSVTPVSLLAKAVTSSPYEDVMTFEGFFFFSTFHKSAFPCYLQRCHGFFRRKFIIVVPWKIFFSLSKRYAFIFECKI